MAIGEEAGDGDISGFGDSVAESIQTIDHTVAVASDPIGTRNHDDVNNRRRQADFDDLGEGNPLLANSTAVVIDAPIGKLKRMHGEVENAVQTDKDKTSQQRDFDDEDRVNELASIVVEPPDGGLRAWMIMIASFTINGVLFSIINTYSLIYPELQKRLTEAGETEVSSKAALVGSLTIGTTFFLSPVAGILTDKFGIQTTTFVGGVIASAGLLLSSLLTDKTLSLRR